MYLHDGGGTLNMSSDFSVVPGNFDVLVDLESLEKYLPTLFDKERQKT